MKYRIIQLLPALVLLLSAGCRKTDFASIGSPAYIRVFNCLDNKMTLNNKDLPLPYLTMLIDPVLDKNGMPTSAGVTGDFLGQRGSWARPYPDAVNNAIWQTEYPGNLKILAAPVLNGYDLSSWAQVSSGKHRIIFQTRPFDNTPYFQLDPKLKGVTLVDTTVDLKEQEVYTLEVLQQKYLQNTPFLYLRNETFVKQPISDSMVYVNFYNLSAAGYADYTISHPDYNKMQTLAMGDSMTAYFSEYRSKTKVLVPGYRNIPMGTVNRSQVPVVTPYYTFPLFADTSTSRIFTGNLWQLFTFCGPGWNPENIVNLSAGTYTAIQFGDYGLTGGNYFIPYAMPADLRTGLIVSIHSGRNNPRSFATVNSIEFINGKFYLTTIQRKFDPPIY